MRLQCPPAEITDQQRIILVELFRRSRELSHRVRPVQKRGIDIRHRVERIKQRLVIFNFPVELLEGVGTDVELAGL